MDVCGSARVTHQFRCRWKGPTKTTTQESQGSEGYHPKIVRYFDGLESKYGERFTFDILADSELLKMECLTREALQRDTRITEDDQNSARPLLMLIEKQCGYRRRYETGLRKVTLT